MIFYIQEEATAIAHLPAGDRLRRRAGSGVTQ